MSVRSRLFVMMVVQIAIWGAWAPKAQTEHLENPTAGLDPGGARP